MNDRDIRGHGLDLIGDVLPNLEGVPSNMRPNGDQESLGGGAVLFTHHLDGRRENAGDGPSPPRMHGAHGPRRGIRDEDCHAIRGPNPYGGTGASDRQAVTRLLAYPTRILIRAYHPHSPPMHLGDLEEAPHFKTDVTRKPVVVLGYGSWIISETAA